MTRSNPFETAMKISRRSEGHALLHQNPQSEQCECTQDARSAAKGESRRKSDMQLHTPDPRKIGSEKALRPFGTASAHPLMKIPNALFWVTHPHQPPWSMLVAKVTKLVAHFDHAVVNDLVDGVAYYHDILKEFMAAQCLILYQVHMRYHVLNMHVSSLICFARQWNF